MSPLLHPLSPSCPAITGINLTLTCKVWNKTEDGERRWRSQLGKLNFPTNFPAYFKISRTWVEAYGTSACIWISRAKWASVITRPIYGKRERLLDSSHPALDLWAFITLMANGLRKDSAQQSPFLYQKRKFIFLKLSLPLPPEFIPKWHVCLKNKPRYYEKGRKSRGEENKGVLMRLCDCITLIAWVIPFRSESPPLLESMFG